LIQLPIKQTVTARLDDAVVDVKNIPPQDLINFFDKILDKLFQILTFTKSPKTQDLVFETIIQIIQLFQTEYKEQKHILENYINNHFAHTKAYLSLVHQLRQTSELVKIGFREETDLSIEDCLL